jgi:biotin--protein ligase
MRPTAAAAGAAAGAAASQHAGPAAFVYSGPGAGTRSVLSAMHSLRATLLPEVTVSSLDTPALLDGAWRSRCLLLVMPGGADLPYCKHLDGRGNQLIRGKRCHGCCPAVHSHDLTKGGM